MYILGVAITYLSVEGSLYKIESFDYIRRSSLATTLL